MRHQALGWLGLVVAIAAPITWWGRQQMPLERTSAIRQVPLVAPTPSISSQAAVGELSDADAAAITTVIQQQMDAFQADDAELAFSFASPTIQAQFQSAAQFMAMVRSQYATVYRPQAVEFGDLEWVDDSPVQAVVVLGPVGEWMTAYYPMEQQADSTWRIAGCVLVPLPGETI
ncbi:MAG: DUF4864 domain-containing protein [Cyanobacteria bacterium P01_H01_bin.162]